MGGAALAGDDRDGDATEATEIYVSRGRTSATTNVRTQWIQGTGLGGGLSVS